MARPGTPRPGGGIVPWPLIMQQLLSGYPRVTRASWNDEHRIVRLQPNAPGGLQQLEIIDGNGRAQAFNPTEDDLAAYDWELAR